MIKKTILFFIFIFTGIISSLSAQNDSLNSVADTVILQTERVSANISSSLIPVQGVSFDSVWRGIVGMIVLIVIAFAFSRDRKHINWRVVFLGLSMQFIIALAILYVPFVQYFFEILGRIFIKIMDFTKAGTSFLFGSLIDMRKTGYVFVFQVLPTIIFFSALTSVLYYLNIIQTVVKGLAWILKKTFKVSGAEGLTVAGNIFLGVCEAPMLAKRYLPRMNRSEIFLVMSAGLATIAGGVMAAYIGMLGGENLESRILFAKYLLSASVMAAPGVIAISKIIMPQTESVDTDIKVSRESAGKNVLEAVSKGTVEGLKLAVVVAAMLLTFIALVALANYLLGGLVGKYTGLNDWLLRISDGRYAEFNFQFLLGIIFTPVAWLMGVCNADMNLVGSLIGTKLITNEFVAYGDLSQLKAAGAFIEEKSIIMSTYVLCGFANIGSVGIMIGGLSQMAPDHNKWFTRYGMLAMICGTLVSCMSATIMGMILG